MSPLPCHVRESNMTTLPADPVACTSLGWGTGNSRPPVRLFSARWDPGTIMVPPFSTVNAESIHTIVTLAMKSWYGAFIRIGAPWM